MCGSQQSGAFERGRHEIRTGRRTLLAAGAAGVAISSLPGAALAATTTTRKRAYVLVLDGCRPDEITPTLMPRTSALRDGGSTIRARRRCR